MLAAAIVLYFSAGSRMIRAATMQGVFPLLTWLSWLII
jgi:putative membrane protein